tara:strand:+ start:6066 stop:6803 length:738 start_codon:yes stop_codon:yes gene_type:complete
LKTIVTLLYGDKYNADDVHRIYHDTKQYRHVCIVDDKNKKYLNKNIETLPAGEDETFEKIKVFSHDWHGDCIFLDLDLIVQGSLDKVFRKEPTICYCYWKIKEHVTHGDHKYDSNQVYLKDGNPNAAWMQRWKGLWNSSVMAWSDNNARYIYDHFKKHDQYYMTKYCGDDRFLYHENLFSNVFPRGLIYSWLNGVDSATDVSPRAYQIKPDYPIVLLNGQKSKEQLRQEYYDAFSMHKMGQQIQS